MATSPFNKPLSANYVSSDGATKTLPHATPTLMESLNLEPGVYVITMSAQFATNGTGLRAVGNNATIPTGPRNGVTSAIPYAGTYTTIQHTDIYYSAGGAVNCYCYQNSGGPLDVWTKIQAIRIS